jgi:hypothetical protein
VAKHIPEKDIPLPENLLTEVTEAVQKEVADNIPKEPITIDRPVLEFCVLASLARNGVYFTDLSTGEAINGLLYLPQIGISLTPPETNEINLGFLNLGQKRPRKLAPNTFEVDGVLYFEYDGKECITGKLDNFGRYLWFIKIWNDIDMRIWEEIIKKVVDDNTKIVDGAPYPLAYFIVSSAFVPDKADKPSRLVLTKNQANTQSKAPSVVLESTALPEENIKNQRPYTPIF